jgi:hypothetical protein
VGYPPKTLPDPRYSWLRPSGDRYQECNQSAGPRQDDLLALSDAVKQLREVGFHLIYVDAGGHGINRSQTKLRLVKSYEPNSACSP